MASSPTFRDPESYESHGSTYSNTDCSPFRFPSASALPYLLPDAAAPVFPILIEDLGFGLTHAEQCCRDATSLNSVSLDERHVFLCFKEPRSWPPVVEAADFDRLPRLLAAAIKNRKNEMSKKTRLTICEGKDGTESSNGDVMIFPDMVRYRGLTHFDVDTFVDEVLVQNQDWVSGRPERLSGTHIFVCAHASHDPLCGVSGPLVIGKLKEEIYARGLDGLVFVRPCSHIGGHKYTGNLIVYGLRSDGEILARCYGYVTADHVCSLLNELIGQRTSLDEKWRIRHALTDDKFQEGTPTSADYCEGNVTREDESSSTLEQNNGNTIVNPNFCWSHQLKPDRASQAGSSRRFYSNYRWWQASWWFVSWERDDTLAALAILGAAASVAVAYHLYRVHARS